MRLLLVVSLLVVLPELLVASNRAVDVIEDNDFAEFEESDDGQQLIFTGFFVLFYTASYMCVFT